MPGDHLLPELAAALGGGVMLAATDALASADRLLRDLATGLGPGVIPAVKGVLAFVAVVTVAWIAWMLVAGAARQVAAHKGQSEADGLASAVFLRPVIMIAGLAAACQASGLVDLGMAGWASALLGVVRAVVWALGLGAVAIAVVGGVGLIVRRGGIVPSLVAGYYLRSKRAKAHGLPRVGDRVAGEGFAGQIIEFGRHHCVLEDGEAGRLYVPNAWLLGEMYRVVPAEAASAAVAEPEPTPEAEAPGPSAERPAASSRRLIT